MNEGHFSPGRHVMLILHLYWKAGRMPQKNKKKIKLVCKRELLWCCCWRSCTLRCGTSHISPSLFLVQHTPLSLLIPTIGDGAKSACTRHERKIPPGGKSWRVCQGSGCGRVWVKGTYAAAFLRNSPHFLVAAQVTVECCVATSHHSSIF